MMAKRKLLGLVAIGMVLGLISAAPSYAALVAVNDLVKFQPSEYRPGYGGGLFDVYVKDTYAFKTFCLEVDERISFGVTYRVDSMGDAVGGGQGGPSPDPISKYTAYLYSRFYWGTLSGFDITDGNDQRGVQEAIWYFEEEYTSVTALAKEWVDLAELYASDTDLTLVKAFNPVDVGTGEHKQSGIVYVPEPGTMILLGSGLLGLTGFGARRKFRK